MVSEEGRLAAFSSRHYIATSSGVRVMQSYSRPRDIAAKFAKDRARRGAGRTDSYRRDTFSLPREAARDKAREMCRRYPKAAYMTAIEGWRELPGGAIEFTMRRLPTAD